MAPLKAPGNLEKAYDRVSWDFICASLMAVRILEFLRKVIMLSMLIPKGVYAEFERLPRPRGRLGFRHLSDQNMSFLMKIGFNLVSKSNALWVRVLQSKYGWKEQIPETINRSQCSHLWWSLSKIYRRYSMKT
ncbi:hypothetical protein J1N35_024075 [Gossypium stocksii]|uniref:Uncharacterized protein n=1 Tax=Gossypium stocksii TaxID=47602 RepID=A0A9D3VKS8_9ROSI|nr:hypothetical protein J1N35_024075 [Gossypium stocksii]